MIPIQIIGYKNSGKTTLVSQLVEGLSRKGYKVATLKHHGHGGPPSSVENTDSYKFSQAGAILSGVEGDGMLHLAIQQQSWDIEQILAFYQLIKIDILLIEGYKHLDFNKIVILRSEEDVPLVKRTSNIKAVVTRVDLSKDICPYPMVQGHDMLDWVTNNLFLFKEGIRM